MNILEGNLVIARHEDFGEYIGIFVGSHKKPVLLNQSIEFGKVVILACTQYPSQCAILQKAAVYPRRPYEHNSVQEFNIKSIRPYPWQTVQDYRVSVKNALDKAIMKAKGKQLIELLKHSEEFRITA